MNTKDDNATRKQSQSLIAFCTSHHIQFLIPEKPCANTVLTDPPCVCTQHHSSSILDKSPLFCHDSEICTRLCFCKRLVLSHDFVLLTFRLACSMHSLLGDTPSMLDFPLASQWIYTLILLNKSNDATKSDRKLESCFCAPTTNVGFRRRLKIQSPIYSRLSPRKKNPTA